MEQAIQNYINFYNNERINQIKRPVS
ncbi:IS3 family transposase [Staphylococcus xylosus]|nr:IS3 family transposase [Staphylococcus xylosus]